MTTILVAALLSAGLGLGFLALLIRMRFSAVQPPPETSWLNGFSLSKYRLMERLLSEADYEFLATQPGYRPSIAKKLRQERRKIFRAYLRSLARDFRRLHGIARWMITHGCEDRPDLALRLVKQQTHFFLVWSLIEIRITLHAGNIDVRGLVGSVQHLWDQIGNMVPAASEAALTR
ncbi:MAG TPA: hypothetical protein VKV15_00050 [Bryobacteraceae bacterium]|nr:hypothetical protein [Bryobacteraceae bacterium]